MNNPKKYFYYVNILCEVAANRLAGPPEAPRVSSFPRVRIHSAVAKHITNKMHQDSSRCRELFLLRTHSLHHPKMFTV
jgi:hypothetical protein